MSGKPKILCVGDFESVDSDVASMIRERFDMTAIDSSLGALAEIAGGDFACVYVVPDKDRPGFRLARLLQNERILEELPVGAAILTAEHRLVWANNCLHNWIDDENIIGQEFYSLLGSEGGDDTIYCPLRLARETGHTTGSSIKTNDNRYFRFQCVPLKRPESPNESPEMFIVTIQDVTTEALQQQKLSALHQAGRELADLTAEEVFEMAVEQRIDLLKSNILHHSKHILNFDVLEIRLLGDRDTHELVPLLSVGIEEEAATRPLFAELEGYGVTGYVAATGTSYLCNDTRTDRRYLEGCKDARSSMTVPLIQHDQIIGTFNVESPEARRFDQRDLQFLETFARDVANALNTLELLVAQQANTAQASVEAIHSAVALPVDEILNDAVNVMEQYIGHDQQVVDRLRRILQNARDIKGLIHKVGDRMTPAEAVPAGLQMPDHPQLHGRRVLVVDEDVAVRGAAHDLLERYNCVVETAHDGGEAMRMVRSLDGPQYDAILSEIRLPDMSGHDLFLRLKEIMDPVPMVLMTGFGYDPGHTIVKARQAGLAANAVLYKPFRLDQLLQVVESVIETMGQVHHS
ncbi:MAG: response regulator [Planctomycetales bacterium]|nr:response regulator [Planctomycetales bacterium]